MIIILKIWQPTECHFDKRKRKQTCKHLHGLTFEWMKTAVMCVVLIFQLTCISLFPEEPQTLSQTTPSLGLWESSLFSFMCPCFQSSRTFCYYLTQQTGQLACWGLQQEFLNSPIPRWMRRTQIIIHIPESLPLHTRRTSCYLNTIQDTQQSKPGCASLWWVEWWL